MLVLLKLILDKWLLLVLLVHLTELVSSLLVFLFFQLGIQSFIHFLVLALEVTQKVILAGMELALPFPSSAFLSPDSRSFRGSLLSLGELKLLLGDLSQLILVDFGLQPHSFDLS